MGKSVIAVIFLIIASTSVLAQKVKSQVPTAEEKKICRESTTIIDTIAQARDKGTNLKDAREQRIGFAETKQMVTAIGKQVTEDEIKELNDTMIDAVFILMANRPRTLLLADYFNLCIKDITQSGK